MVPNLNKSARFKVPEAKSVSQLIRIVSLYLYANTCGIREYIKLLYANPDGTDSFIRKAEPGDLFRQGFHQIYVAAGDERTN